MRKKINYRFILLIFIVFTFWVFTSNKVFALTLSPARLEISGDPGQTVIKEITLLNDTKSEATYYVSYANFEAQGETGSPLFVEPKSDLGTWMSTDKSITIPAGESKNVNLKIKIPKDAYAGGHFAVVFFGNNPDKEGQVSVGAKTGTLVLLSVNGDVLEAGGLSSFSTVKNKKFYNSLPVSFQYRWKNDGNDRVKPEGRITIRSLFVIPVKHINANQVSGNVLPHSTRMFNVDWIKYINKNDDKPTSLINSYFKTVSYQWRNFAMGPYIAHISLVAGTDGIKSTSNTFFFVFPWQLILLMVIVLIILIIIFKKLLRRYNNYIIEKAKLGMSKPSDANHD